MFNVQGSEFIFLLLIALLVLGPEKLPDAIRKFGRAYAEFKKMANGFQGEFNSALGEPLRELRNTADAMREAVRFDLEPKVVNLGDVGTDASASATTPASAEPAASTGLNFGSMQRSAEPAAPAQETPPAAPTTPDTSGTGGLNFGRMQRDEGSAE